MRSYPPLAVVLPVRVTSSLIEEVSVDVNSSDMEARVFVGDRVIRSVTVWIWD